MSDSPESPEDRLLLQNFDDMIERFRPVLRWLVFVSFLVIVTADAFLYSVYQADHSRVVTMDRRIDRLETMVTEAIHAKENAEKIKTIESQVKSIETEISGVADLLKEVGKPEEEKPEVKKPRRKRK